MAPKNPKKSAGRFERSKRESVLQLLIKCARLVNEQALDCLPETEGPRPRPSHMALFPHIDREGIRLTALASKVGISKQAAGQLVDDLVEMNLVERRPDPSDGRAKRIAFTDVGYERLALGLQHLNKMQAEFEAALGRSLEPLRDILLPLHDLLDRED